MNTVNLAPHFNSYTRYLMTLGHCCRILIYVSTAIGLTPGGSSTVHIYIQTIRRTAQ